MNTNRITTTRLRVRQPRATVRHSHPALERGALLVGSAAAFYAIWLGVGLPPIPSLPGLPGAGHEAPIVAELAVPTAPNRLHARSSRPHAAPSGPHHVRVRAPAIVHSPVPAGSTSHRLVRKPPLTNVVAAIPTPPTDTTPAPSTSSTPPRPNTAPLTAPASTTASASSPPTSPTEPPPSQDPVTTTTDVVGAVADTAQAAVGDVAAAVPSLPDPTSAVPAPLQPAVSAVTSTVSSVVPPPVRKLLPTHP